MLVKVSVNLSFRLDADLTDWTYWSTSIRQCVASNPHTSPEVLTQLSEDSNRQVRQSVIGNPSTPPRISAQLEALEAAYQVTES